MTFDLALVSTEELQEEIDRRASVMAERGERFVATLTVDQTPGGDLHVSIKVPGAAREEAAAILVQLGQQSIKQVLSSHGVDPDTETSGRIDHASLN